MIKSALAYIQNNKLFFYVILLSLLIKSVLNLYNLPNYSIDENEVVEVAIGITQGDLDHKFYKYGPLVSYIIAIVFNLYAFILSIFSSDYNFTNDVLQNVFFIKSDFYYIARFIQSVFSIISAIFVYKILKLKFRSKIAYLGLILCLIPFNEILSSYTIRIDSFMGTFGIASIYYLLCYSDSKNKKEWYLSVFLGSFIFAVKPLPSASIFAVFVLSTIYFKHDFDTIFRTVVVIFISIFITYPYSILNFKAFYDYNYTSLLQGGDAMANKIMGYDFTWFPLYFGYAFSFICLLSFIYIVYLIFKKVKETPFNLIISVYPLIYILLFLTFGIRPYWYLAILPFLFLYISIFYEDIIATKLNLNHKYTIIIFGLVLIAETGLKFSERFIDSLFKEPTAQIMFNEVQSKIKNNEKLVIVSPHFLLTPLLISNDIQKEASRGDYFMYHRSQFKKYVNLYSKAFKNYPYHKYSIYDVKLDYKAQIDPKKKVLLEETLPKFMKQNKIKYMLVYVGDKEYKAPWEDDFNLEIELNADQNYYGRNYKLFSIKD